MRQLAMDGGHAITSFVPIGKITRFLKSSIENELEHRIQIKMKNWNIHKKWQNFILRENILFLVENYILIWIPILSEFEAPADHQTVT